MENLDTKKVVQWFLRKFVEAKAFALEKDKNWKAFNAILSLLIYKIILFPNIDDFVDLTTINIFLAKNHILALLVDVYYYLHVRHENKKGMVIFYAPLL